MNASAGTELLQAAGRLKGVGVICTDTDGYYSMFDPTMILVLIGVFLSLGCICEGKQHLRAVFKSPEHDRHDGSRGGETAFKFTGHL